jgi:hypothetical protein
MKKLKVGDKIRFVSLPDFPTLTPATRRLYKKLIAGRRHLTVDEIDEFAAWVSFRLRRKNGSLEYHSLAIVDGDNNWVFIKPRS